MGMTLESFSTSDFFVSFSQLGVFLDQHLMDQLGVSKGDHIRVELLFEEDLISGCYGIVNPKKDWNIDLEKQAYGRFWYSSKIVEEVLSRKNCIVLGYVEWESLTLNHRKKDVLLSNPLIRISRLVDTAVAKEVILKVTRSDFIPEKIKFLEFPNVISEKMEILVWVHTKKTKQNPINKRKVGLLSLPQLGSSRRRILVGNKITNLLRLISYPVEQIRKIQGISDSLIVQWILDVSKILEPSAPTSFKARVFLTNPRRKKVAVVETTNIVFKTPQYLQLYVRGRPWVESRVLGGLLEWFGSEFNATMPEEKTIILEKKDGTREIEIRGSWIVEMMGFNEEENEVVLEDLEYAISSSMDADVIRLIEPQKGFF